MYCVLCSMYIQYYTGSDSTMRFKQRSYARSIMPSLRVSSRPPELLQSPRYTLRCLSIRQPFGYSSIFSRGPGRHSFDDRMPTRLYCLLLGTSAAFTWAAAREVGIIIKSRGMIERCRLLIIAFRRVAAGRQVCLTSRCYLYTVLHCNWQISPRHGILTSRYDREANVLTERPKHRFESAIIKGPFIIYTYPFRVHTTCYPNACSDAMRCSFFHSCTRAPYCVVPATASDIRIFGIFASAWTILRTLSMLTTKMQKNYTLRKNVFRSKINFAPKLEYYINYYN